MHLFYCMLVIRYSDCRELHQWENPTYINVSDAGELIT